MSETTSFLAADLAVGWLSVALAASTDDELPVLSRTVSIEQYSTGVRLCATDRHVLLHSWIGHEQDREAPEPMLDEAPSATAVAIDSNGRGAGLLKHLLKLARKAAKDEQPPPTAALTLNVPEEDGIPEPAFGGMESVHVVIEHPGQEMVRLRTFGGDYPDWRPMHAAFVGKATKDLALDPDIIGRLASLGGLHNGAPLIWRFGGPNKVASVEMLDTVPAVSGLVMPVRWLERQQEQAA